MSFSRSNKETDTKRINRLADQFYEDVKDACADDCAYPIISPTAFGFKKVDSDGERAEQLLALHIYGSTFELIRRKFGQEIEEALYGPRNPPIPPGELFQYQKENVAEAYGLAGKPSKPAFARYMADYNKGRARDDRFGSGSEDPHRMEAYLKKLLRKKKYRDHADRGYRIQEQRPEDRLVIPNHFFKKPGRKSGSIFKKVVPR